MKNTINDFTPAEKTTWQASDESQFKVNRLIELQKQVELKQQTMATLEQELHNSTAQELIAFSQHVLKTENNTALSNKIVDILTSRMLPWTEC